MKYIFNIFLLSFSVSLVAQSPADTFWHFNQFHPRKMAAIDFDRAEELAKDKKQDTIIVAVIDAGMDINHEDLISNLWVNRKEIAGNKKDDDGNGYVDDIHGWNFIGGPDSSVTHDNMELTRLFVKLSKVHPSKLGKMGYSYEEYEKIKLAFLSKQRSAEANYNNLRPFKAGFNGIISSIGENPSLEELQAYRSRGRNEEMARNIAIGNISSSKGKLTFKEFSEQFIGYIDYLESQYKFYYNVDFDPRYIVGDNYDDPYEKYYGNNDLYAGEHSDHGTHVAGIIAANRDNEIGAKGICRTAVIMTLRCVPDGDERDKDVANSIRYAVDNGAKIINMSFGKEYSPYADLVDSAIAYAISKNVLLVHAAGNDSKNLDKSNNFPNNVGEKHSKSYLTVGALNFQKRPRMIAEFSNYGKKKVDIFAPGVKIYSTMPENKYEPLDGTSMAAPVVSGVAAYLWSYYPEFTAEEIKEIIMKSGSRIRGWNKVPGKKFSRKRARRLSKTGKAVNAYRAMKLAEKKLNSKKS
jgi:subtilisin family serine protease